MGVVCDKRRESGIELLRIVAMLLIMVGHTHLRLSPMPQLDTIDEYPLSAYLEVMSSCIATTGVGIFIAISGWFGIRFRLEGIGKYIFQVLFVLWAVYGGTMMLHVADFNTEGIRISMSFYEGYWFVLGYLGLYLISPILNSFVEHSTKKEFQVVLLSYYLFQSYYSWLSAWYDYYGGYSIILFGGIYLTAAYLRKYPIEFVQKHSVKLLVVIVLIMTAIAYFSLWKFGHAARQIRDDNPLVIFASILLLLSFNRLKFQSRVVNSMAASCFAVYLIHYSPFVYPYLMSLVRTVYTQLDGCLYVLLLILTLSAVYLGCTLFDQVRILSWKALLRTKKEMPLPNPPLKGREI